MVPDALSLLSWSLSDRFLLRVVVGETSALSSCDEVKDTERLGKRRFIADGVLEADFPFPEYILMI